MTDQHLPNALPGSKSYLMGLTSEVDIPGIVLLSVLIFLYISVEKCAGRRWETHSPSTF